MERITTGPLEQALDSFFSLEEDEAINTLIDDMGEQQPFLFTFLMTMGEGDFNDDEREVLLFLGVTIWQIVSFVYDSPPQITEEALDQVEQQNLPLLEDLSSDQESTFIQEVQALAAKHPQADIMQYLVEAVMEEQEEGTVREINQGILIVFLKIVLECFDQLEMKRA
ncbi:MAG: hypothetical protein AAFQ83_14285 [Bacteroidota bacterium]